MYRTKLAVVALAAMLGACGDGNGPHTSAVRVAGDSLNDSGTFGFKATVQGSSLADTLIWTDHVADAVGVAPLCPRYVASDPAAAPDDVRLDSRPDAARCTSHGVMRARINVPDGTLGGDLSPFSIRQQLKDLATASSYGPEELLLVDGGGNDVADLLRYFLAFSLELQLPLAPAETSFYKLLAEHGIIPDAADELHLAAAGGRYMQALADRLADDLATFAIDKGARRVVVLNIPQVTKTPYLKAMQARLTQISGAQEASRVMSMVDDWIRAFNLRLQSRFTKESRVAVVDFYTRFGLWVDSPADFGFTDSSGIACPPEAGKFDSLGLPVYLLANCQAARLSASHPDDPDWWTTHVFSDDFHGSPMTNRLMADLVLHKLRERGWL